MLLSKPKLPYIGRRRQQQHHHGHLNHHRGRHGPILLFVACSFAAASSRRSSNHFASSSVFFVHAATAAEEPFFANKESNANNNNNNNNVSFQQVFQAIDSNRDHSISEDEYLAAVNKLVGGAGVGDGDGRSVLITGRDSIIASAATVVDAPPLGMDYNPFASSSRKHDTINTFSATVSSSSATAFFKGLVSSFSAIIATEIGDKTFFIAAVLSMRNDRMAVFGGAILALIIMTILSTLMGLVLPALLPKKYTHIIGGLLFLYFGVKLLLDSRSMQENKVSEELEEVEEELAEMSKKQSKARKKKRAEEEGKGSRGGKPLLNGIAHDADDDTAVDVEGGGGGRGQQQQENTDSDMNGAKKRRGGGGGGDGGGSSGRTIKHAPSSSGLSAAGNYSGGSWESVFVQSLTLTFLAEWGDRSQIATIALAAAKVRDWIDFEFCRGCDISS